MAMQRFSFLLLLVWIVKENSMPMIIYDKIYVVESTPFCLPKENIRSRFGIRVVQIASNRKSTIICSSCIRSISHTKFHIFSFWLIQHSCSVGHGNFLAILNVNNSLRLDWWHSTKFDIRTELAKWRRHFLIGHKYCR